MSNTKGKLMGESLRKKLQDMMIGVRLPGHDLSQFTLDWIEALDEPAGEIRPGDDDGSLCYRIDTICEVLKLGPDKDFFEMVRTYARLYTNS